MKQILRIFLLVGFLLTACSSRPLVTPVPIVPDLSDPAPAPNPAIPDFKYIVILIFENKEATAVLDSPEMATLKSLIGNGTLLTRYYAVAHPSMPNYIALIGGDTYGFDHACKNCDIDVTSLPDLIERSGRTWKTYQEDMPSLCYLDASDGYVTKHNPFIFFSPIVEDRSRCERSVVPLTRMFSDLESGAFPNYAFVVPNLCHSGHDCGLDMVDAWLESVVVDTLLPQLDKTGENYLVVLTWDEGDSTDSCCELPAEAGGMIPTVLISPSVMSNYQDSTPYTHYSLLRTVSEGWGLPLLGHAADPNHALILAPWK